MGTVSHLQPQNAPIHVDESGPPDAPVVVLIHGSLDRSAGMARLARVLAGRSRVVRYDRRGYGRSWPHAGPFTVDDQVEDLVGVLQGRPAVLVGHSFGGQVALATAATLGSQIVGVSTYETPLSWLEWWPRDSAGAAGVHAGPELAAERFLTRLVGRDTWDRLPEHTKEARRREGRALVGELGALREGPRWNPEDVGCRVMCGVGEQARDHHRRATQWLVAHLPHSEFVTVPGAGHGAPNSHPVEFCELLVLPHLPNVAER